MEKRGFTAVEVLLTLGILAVTAGVSVPLYRTYQVRSDLDIAVEQAKHALERAQVLARAGQNDSMWGYEALRGILFQGESYATRDDAADEEYIIPGGVTVSGLTEVVFQRVTGDPLTSGVILFVAANGEQRTVTVTEGGGAIAGELLPPDEGQSSSAITAESSSAVSASEGVSSGSTEGSTSSSTSMDAGASESSSVGSDDAVGEGDAGGSSSEATCEDAFTILPDGTVQTTGTVDATIKVLGSQVSDGAGGKSAKVIVSLSTDDGETWTPLFDGKAVKGGEQTIIQNLPSGTHLVLKVNGRHSLLFNRTFVSNNAAGHMLVLRNGSGLPISSFDALKNPGGLAAFLRALIANNTMQLPPRTVLFLTELDALWKRSSKFQDAAVQVTFAVTPGSCAQETEPRMKILFDRIENSRTGDAANRVYVGPNAIAFAEGQWIPLAAAGVMLTDTSLVEDVPGLALERRSGVVRVLLHGSHTGGEHKEIVDARIVFENAHVESVENDAGADALENPFDGVVNDGSGGDEATVAAGNQSVLLRTRVTTADDALLIRWALGRASSSSTSASDSSASSEASSATSASDDGETENCTVAYIVDERGRIVLQEKADVTFTVLGSYATHGENGPMIHVRLSTSFDGGVTWRGLWNLRDILAGDHQTFQDIPAESAIALSAEGRYSWLFKRVARTGEEDERIRVFRNDDAVPSIGLLQTPELLKSFLRSRMEGGRIHLGGRNLLLLAELQELDATADYQDAAVLVTLTPSARREVCGGDQASSDDGFSSTSVSSSVSTSSTSSSSGVFEEQMSVCHVTAGDRQHANTVVINVSAWPAHLAHGDRLGECVQDDDGDGIANAEDFCPGTYMPESVPLEYMLFNRYALTGTSNIFRVGPWDAVSSYTLADTRGCSCEQLVDVAEGVRSYYFDQEPLLAQELRSLFPFYTNGARRYGCGAAIIKMTRPPLASVSRF